MKFIIKRYRNRKLYNTQSKRYITLEQIEELIKEQNEVEVIDNTTGEDITATTLSQVVFELEKNRTGYLPQSLLISLVQSGGNRIDEIRQNVFNALNLTHHYDMEIERRINQLIDMGELTEDVGRQFLEKMLSVSSHQDEIKETITERIEEFLKERQIPTKNDLHSVIRKVEALSQRVEELQNKSQPKIEVAAPKLKH